MVEIWIRHLPICDIRRHWPISPYSVEIPRKKTSSWLDRFEPVTSRTQSGALNTWPQHLVVGCLDGGNVVVLFSGCSLFRKLHLVVSVDIVWIFLDFDCFTNETVLIFWQEYLCCLNPSLRIFGTLLR